jgi:3-methyladenine DNA glycosylase AlkD
METIPAHPESFLDAPAGIYLSPLRCYDEGMPPTSSPSLPRRTSDIVRRLKRIANPADAAGMARFGIRSENVLGISVATLRAMAGEIGRDHALALALWKTGIFEARVLALLVDDPAAVTERQMERWARDFNNWAICDGVCLHLFRKTPFAWAKAVEWAGREEEFVKRAGFVLMAVLAVNGVKKAVNWALRQIGKRNRALHSAAVEAAQKIRALDSPSARWIASDALREFKGAVVRRKFIRMEKKK